MNSNPFQTWKGGAQREGQRSGKRVHEGLPFGAGLGWREARRRGLGTAQVPETERRLNRCDPAA
ncbi:MAG TPA: hypothetical protein VFC44_03260 [Candidatus Saccharimonadales bacterium]|nr:hypothetical protein [Candidatus Saccharimonadales bacterium]